MKILGAILVLVGLYALWGPGFAALLFGRAGLIGQVIVGIDLIAGGVAVFIKART